MKEGGIEKLLPNDKESLTSEIEKSQERLTQLEEELQAAQAEESSLYTEMASDPNSTRKHAWSVAEGRVAELKGEKEYLEWYIPDLKAKLEKSS